MILEIVGALLALGLHAPLLFIYLLATGTTLGLCMLVLAIVGYAATLVVLRNRSGVFRDRMERRALIDLWLAIFPAVAALTVPMVNHRFPISQRGWDAHGFGATGGEVNALLIPWIQLVLWIGAGKLLALRRALSGSRS